MSKVEFDVSYEIIFWKPELHNVTGSCVDELIQLDKCNSIEHFEAIVMFAAKTRADQRVQCHPLLVVSNPILKVTQFYANELCMKKHSFRSSGYHELDKFTTLIIHRDRYIEQSKGSHAGHS